jgi:hypothetical protein
MTVFDSLLDGLDGDDRDRTVHLIQDQATRERERAEHGDVARHVDRGPGPRRPRPVGGLVPVETS